jgi:iron-sulfur cluster insertion protein
LPAWTDQQVEVKETIAMTTTEQNAQPAIALSHPAAAKVALLLAEEGEDGLGLRVAVRAGGCSGFSYEMFFDTETSSDDHVTVAGSVIVRVDSASAPHLVGATLNYSDGVQDAGFSIDNPNAKRSCGCGQSFS